MRPWGTNFNHKQTLLAYRSHELKSCHYNHFNISVLEPFVTLYETVLHTVGHIDHPPQWLPLLCKLCTSVNAGGSIKKSLRGHIRKDQILNKCSYPWMRSHDKHIYVCVCVWERERESDRQREAQKDGSCFFALFYFFCLGVRILEQHKGSPCLLTRVC